MSDQIFSKFLVIATDDSRLSAKEVDYMELEGAVKDADCHKVKVDGGVSTKLGCCNVFKHREGEPLQFRCGTCQFLKESQ